MASESAAPSPPQPADHTAAAAAAQQPGQQQAQTQVLQEQQEEQFRQFQRTQQQVQQRQQILQLQQLLQAQRQLGFMQQYGMLPPPGSPSSSSAATVDRAAQPLCPPQPAAAVFGPGGFGLVPGAAPFNMFGGPDFASFGFPGQPQAPAFLGGGPMLPLYGLSGLQLARAPMWMQVPGGGGGSSAPNPGGSGLRKRKATGQRSGGGSGGGGGAGGSGGGGGGGSSGGAAATSGNRHITGRGGVTVSLKHLVDGGTLKPGENALSLTYKGHVVSLHLASDGTIVWPADPAVGRARQVFTSPTECSTTIRRSIHPGAPDNSGWRFIKYGERFLAYWKIQFLLKHYDEGDEGGGCDDGLTYVDLSCEAHVPGAAGPGRAKRGGQLEEVDDDNDDDDDADGIVENDPDDELTLNEAVAQWEANGRMYLQQQRDQNSPFRYAAARKKSRGEREEGGSASR